MVSFFGWPAQKKWWSHCDGWPTQVERGKSGLILWVTYPGEGMASFFGWPTQVKKKDGEWSHSLGDLPRKNGGLIVMGDLPRWKNGKTVLLWWVTYPDGKNVKCGLIVMGDLPRWKKCEVWSRCNGWPTQMEKIWWSGLVVMGDLPK